MTLSIHKKHSSHFISPHFSSSPMATLSFSLLPKTLSTPQTLLKPSLPHRRTTSLLSLRQEQPWKSSSVSSSPSLSRRTGVVIRAAAGDDYSARRSSNNGEQRETIMLPGCDYNHWLIVMEFPKDPAPSREQMIDTYLDTLSTVLGSMEEAKKNMYAFSTTTYTGFQCTVDEETSEKFKGLPGVLWVLPDSYIDVKNKDYGGDKYINGEIVPCKYPTYQPKKRDPPKYASRRYERRRDGPPAAKPKQEAASSETETAST